MPLYIEGFDALRKKILKKRQLTVDAVAGAFRRTEKNGIIITSYSPALPLGSRDMMRLSSGCRGKEDDVGKIIYITTRNGLPAKHAFFAYLPNEEKYGHERTLKACYGRMLRIACGKGIKSIVICPLELSDDNRPSAYEKLINEINRQPRQCREMDIYVAVKPDINFSELAGDNYMRFKTMLRALKNGTSDRWEIMQKYTENFTPLQKRLVELAIENDELSPEAALKCSCIEAPRENIKPPADFKPDRNVYLKYLYDYTNKYSAAKLAKRAYLSDSTVSKILYSKKYNTTPETVMALAIAMGLNKEQRYEFIRNSGAAHYPATEKELAVESILEAGTCDLAEVNEKLYDKDPKWVLTKDRSARRGSTADKSRRGAPAGRVRPAAKTRHDNR